MERQKKPSIDRPSDTVTGESLEPLDARLRSSIRTTKILAATAMALAGLSLYEGYRKSQASDPDPSAECTSSSYSE